MIKTAADLIEAAQQKISCVDIPRARELYDAADEKIILDVRETDSAAESKLTDSVNISRGLVEMKLPKVCPNADTLILTHCGGGGRASLTALTLQEMGYTNVHAITARYEDLKKEFG